jgi:hypothetical protein
MKSILALFGMVAALAGPSGAANADTTTRPPDVTLRTEPPVVDVPAHPAGRQFLDLPALEYTFDVEAHCNDDWVPESLSLNVADSRVVLGEDQLSGAEPSKVVLSVPARQLAPVAVHGFCLLEDDPKPGTDPAVPTVTASPLTIRAVLSAQASLLCRKEAQRRITYVSQPLDVRLACEARSPVATGL